MIIQTNTISPNLNDTENTGKTAVSVQRATEGRIHNDVWTTMDCTVQKETGKSSVYTEAQARQLNNDQMELPTDGGISPSAFINSCMTGEDFKDLSDEETPLEEYTSSQVERAVSRVKKQRSEKRDAVDREVAKEQDSEERLENHLEEKVPATEENVSHVSQAVDMAAQITDFSNESMKFFIGTGMTAVTPENIYASVHGVENTNTTETAADAAARTNTMEIAASAAQPMQETEENDTFSQMENQVSAILDQGGVAVTEETLGIARFLYDNDLPVTAENVKIYQTLEELKEIDPSVLLSRIVDGMTDGISPEKTDLSKISTEEAAELVENLLQTDDTTLRQTFTTEADFIRAKRQLEEIRLSMTAEAARNMAAKGITLDVSHLQEIVEELKVQERQAAESLAQETQIPATAENTKIMADTLDAARQILTAPAEMLGQTRSLYETQTLEDMAETAKQWTAEKLEKTYEAVGTEVRPDLGDRISKAFQNVDDILQELNLETTAANERAVRILAYNQMPLTEESVLDMKAYDRSVTDTLESLKPPVVAEMVKQQINPLDLTMDELAEKVESIRQENTEAEDVSFSRFLWKMDQQGDITQEERQSMIGIYRLLDKVEKSDGAVIGQLVKEGKTISLASLLSATRSRRAAGIDVEVDDDFGGLEEVVEKGTSISDQIQAAYGNTLVKSLQKKLSPRVLRELGDTDMESSLEQLLETCEADGENDAGMEQYYEQMAEQIRAMADDPDGQVQEFLRALEMPDTMSNLAAAKYRMSGRPGRYEELWSEEDSDEILETFDDPDSLDEAYDKIDGQQTEKLAKEKESDDISYDEIVSLTRMAGSISFYRNLRRRQMYEIPLVTEEGITACHVTIQDGSSREKGTVEISMDSESLGKVQATFRVNGTHVKGFATAENSDSLDTCRQILDGFEKDLEEMGYTMDGESLVQGSRSSLHVGNREEGTKNKDLYQIAKTFIVNVKERM
jgi:hypothetical protein